MTYRETFQAIKKLIQSKKISKCYHATLSIEEKKKSANLKKVLIVSVGASAFSIKFDECGFPGTAMFADHPTLHRACDSLAFCEVEGQPYILFCELKSSEPTRHEVSQQFRSAHCFISYLNVLLKEYCDCQAIEAWPRRYFVFHGEPATPLSKRPFVDTFNNDVPDRPLFIPVQSGHKTYIRQLLGKPL